MRVAAGLVLSYFFKMTISTLQAPELTPFWADGHCYGPSVFVITVGGHNWAEPIRSFTVESLDDCVLSCQRMSSDCQAVDLVHQHLSKAPLCTLYSTFKRHAPLRQRIYHDANTLFAGEKICLPSKASATSQLNCSNGWWFEWIPEKQVAGASIFTINVLSGYTVAECLAECAKRPEVCRSVQYSNKLSQCHLLSVSRPTVSWSKGLLIDSSETDIFESGCFVRPQFANATNCQFNTGYGRTVPVSYDQRVNGVNTPRECQELCVSSSPHLCTAYSLDSANGVCYLSNTGNPMEERRISMHQAVMRDRVHIGRLDNCVQLTMTCEADRIRVDLDSLKVVSGDLSSATDAKQCHVKVLNSRRSTLKIPYNKCGTELVADGSFENYVMFNPAQGLSLIDANTRRAKVICQLPSGRAPTINYSLQVSSSVKGDNNVVDVVGHGTPESQESFEFSMLDRNLRPIRHVNAGDYGYFQVKLIRRADEPLPEKFRVVNLTATDARPGNDLLLYDHKGCTMQRNLVSEFEIVDRVTQRSKIVFFAFPETSRVHYKGNVETCYSNCDYFESKCIRSAADIARETNTLRQVLKHIYEN